MKKFLLYIGIAVVLFVVVVYGTYFVLLQQLSFKFIGLNFAQPSAEGEEEGSGFGLPSLSGLVEGTDVMFMITNAAGINFKISNFNLRVEDQGKTPVGNIATIPSVLVNKYSTAELAVKLKNVKVAKITTAFLSGDISNYTYVVSGRLGGFMPFRYRGKLNQIV